MRSPKVFSGVRRSVGLPRRLLLVLLVVALMAAGCAQSVDEPGLLTDFEVDVDEEVRLYDVYIPNGLADGEPPRALVVLLHAQRSSREDLEGRLRARSPYSRWLDVAEEHGIALLIPQGVEGTNGHAGWNDCRADVEGNPTTDDVAFISAAVQATVDAWAMESPPSLPWERPMVVTWLRGWLTRRRTFWLVSAWSLRALR